MRAFLRVQIIQLAVVVVFVFFSGSRSSCTVAAMCHIMSFIHYCFVFHLFVAFLFASPLIKPGPMRLSLLSCDLLPFDLFSFSVS